MRVDFHGASVCLPTRMYVQRSLAVARYRVNSWFCPRDHHMITSMTTDGQTLPRTVIAVRGSKFSGRLSCRHRGLVKKSLSVLLWLTSPLGSAFKKLISYESDARLLRRNRSYTPGLNVETSHSVMQRNAPREEL